MSYTYTDARAFFPPPWVLGMSFSWQVDYNDVLDRVVALPVALTWEEGAQKSRCYPTLVEALRDPSMARGFPAKRSNNSNPCVPKTLNLG